MLLTLFCDLPKLSSKLYILLSKLNFFIVIFSKSLFCLSFINFWSFVKESRDPIIVRKFVYTLTSGSSFFSLSLSVSFIKFLISHFERFQPLSTLNVLQSLGFYLIYVSFVLDVLCCQSYYFQFLF